MNAPIEVAATADVSSSIADDAVIEPVIGAYGMYWERDKVDWKGTPALLGVQVGATKTIDFSAQRGVYVLFDGHRPVYVGRAAQQAIGKRLSSHTRGRMAGRWNRFSWFGLAKPNDMGELDANDVAMNDITLVAALEAVLIEVMEPPLNRKGGDNLKGLEYLQAGDPKLDKQIAAIKDSLVQQLKQLAG